MIDQVLELMNQAGFTTLEQKIQVAQLFNDHPPSKPVPRDVLEADVEYAIQTGLLPTDPDRRTAVLRFGKLALILHPTTTQQGDSTDG